LQDNTLRNKLSLAGQKQASKFSWEKTAGSYLNIFLQ